MLVRLTQPTISIYLGSLYMISWTSCLRNEISHKRLSSHHIVTIMYFVSPFYLQKSMKLNETWPIRDESLLGSKIQCNSLVNTVKSHYIRTS
jgi:hypothetical protein